MLKRKERILALVMAIATAVNPLSAYADEIADSDVALTDPATTADLAENANTIQGGYRMTQALYP